MIWFTKKEKRENKRKDKEIYCNCQILIKKYFQNFNWKNYGDREKLTDLYCSKYELVSLQRISAIVNPTLSCGKEINKNEKL